MSNSLAPRPTFSKLEDLLGEPTKYLGKVIWLNFDEATFITEDAATIEAGGVPRHTFLLAAPSGEAPLDQLILLRVADVNQTIGAFRQTQSMREDFAFSEGDTISPDTAAQISRIAYTCKVEGSFYYENDQVRFGHDLDETLGNSTFDVYKPRGTNLSAIASFGEGDEEDYLKFGRVRYSETESKGEPTAEVYLNINDLIAKKTGLLGTSRSGKSNSIKIVTQKVFELSERRRKAIESGATGKLPIGQLIFDPQGEYARDNVQDGGGVTFSIASLGDESKVSVYTQGKINSPKHKPLGFNVLDGANADLTFSLLYAFMLDSASKESNYITHYSDITMPLGNPTTMTPQERHQHERAFLGMWALLGEAGADFARQKFAKDQSGYSNRFINIGSGAADKATEAGLRVTAKNGLQYDSPAQALRVLDFITSEDVMPTLSSSLQEDITEKGSELRFFLERIREVRGGRNGVTAAMKRLASFHSENVSGDFREQIYNDLAEGKIVILELSNLSEDVIRHLGRLVLQHILGSAIDAFGDGREPFPIQVVAEEAHNVFPSGSDADYTDPWIRLSKEGAKLNIGLLYATQEVTSVDPKILSNTSNWIISHLNSRTETRALAGYYDFEAWADHIRRSESRGFSRVKLLSNPFTLPIQIDKFVPPEDYQASTSPKKNALKTRSAKDPQGKKVSVVASSDDDTDFNSIGF